MYASFIAFTLILALSRVAGYIRDDCQCGVANKESRRITNGVTMKTLKYPWMVRMLNKHNKIFCGGALISDSLVLTASHCVSFDPTSPQYWLHLYAKIESIHLKEGTKIEFNRVFIHPKFSSKKNYDDYDMAIFRFTKPLSSFSTLVQPICIPKFKKNYVGQVAVISGWGTTDPNVLEMSPILREGQIKILHPSQCQFKTNMNSMYNFESMMCGHSNSGVDSCQGDSGGPLFVQMQPNVYEIIGVSSFGLSCGGYYAGIYADVTQSLRWIQNKVNRTGVCPNPQKLN